MTDKQALKPGDFVTTVMGEIITDALAAQLDGIERDIAEKLKAQNYTGIGLLSEKAKLIDFLRMRICTNHLVSLYDIGPERDQQEVCKSDQ